MKPGVFEVKLEGGKSDRVEGYVHCTGLFGVVSEDLINKAWTITHVPTGLAIGFVAGGLEKVDCLCDEMCGAYGGWDTDDVSELAGVAELITHLWDSPKTILYRKDE